MKSEIYAAFKLTGEELDPEQVTALAGIIPSKTWKTGQLVSRRATLRHKDNGWLLKSTLPLSAGLQDHVDSLIHQLQPGWAALVDLGTQYEADLYCVVRSYGGDRPAVFFDKLVVKRVAELSANIDVDLFVFP